jgi:serine/threonine protein kinase
MSQSNNLILIDYNSAHNPSNMGDNDETQSENRVHNYAFGRQIGEGAYAVVRIATSREDNKKYAIKVYDKTKLSDINRQRSVRREVVLLQKMNHEHIVKLVEAFETDSHVYLVMEHVSGGSLHSYLKEMINKQLDEEEGRRIFKQILVALRYCHSKCIAHRDIKLENILLDENKNVKLIDFGFSTCIPNNKKIRMYCGTPSYMSPQIVTKVEYAGPPADVWAAGVLLYALLNGCFPFRGQTDDDLYRRIKRGTYHIHNQKVTHDYLEMLQRCLDPNDDTRASAQDLLDDPWFKIEDIRQKAYDEEKRQFKARILAKVPIIKKSNHTICILA